MGYLKISVPIVIPTPKKYGYVEIMSNVLSIAKDTEDEPTTSKEGIKFHEIDKKRTPMKEEIKSLNQNTTWVLLDKPKMKRLADCKCMDTQKEGRDSKCRNC